MSDDTQHEDKKIDLVVKNYLQLRELKAELEKKHKQRKAKIDDKMKYMEAQILKFFDETGLESARTKYGTPYTQLRESVTVSSRDDFLDFVREHEAWDMLENRASKTAVLEYKDEHEELPPGLSYRAERIINVKSK